MACAPTFGWTCIGAIRAVEPLEDCHVLGAPEASVAAGRAAPVSGVAGPEEFFSYGPRRKVHLKLS